MFERSNALNRILPLSLLLLSFCGPKQKEHQIPYEQMPLELSADADVESRALVQEFKAGYLPHLSSKFSERILKNELSLVKSQNNSDPATLELNKDLVLDTSTPDKVSFSKQFIANIKSPSLNTLKDNLELFIKDQIHTKGTSLVFSKNVSGLLHPILTKKSDGQSYAGLFALIANQLNSRGDLRSQRLVMIFTPGSMSFGFVLRDSEQGQILFAYPNTALGSKAKYYGPLSKIKGSIAVIDLETYIIQKAVSAHLSNIDATREFALDQSSKKFGYKRANLKLDFKTEKNTNVFELAGNTIEKTPDEGTPFADSALNFVSGFSELDAEGVETSFKTHKENLRRQEEERRTRDEQARLGSNYQLEGKWPHSFGSPENIKNFVSEQLKGNKLAPSELIKVLLLERNRECHETSEEGLSPEKNSHLRDWDILGVDESWYFEKIEKDNLGLCRARGPIGTDASPNLIKQYTRILQPIYVFLPANPEKLPDDNFQEKRVEIKEAQRTAMQELSKKVCTHLRMKDVDTQLGIQTASQVRTLWKELFHKETTTVESSYSEFLKDYKYNYFEIKCIFVPTVIPQAPSKSIGDQSENETEEKKPTRRRSSSLSNSRSSSATTQQRVSIGR